MKRKLGTVEGIENREEAKEVTQGIKKVVGNPTMKAFTRIMGILSEFTVAEQSRILKLVEEFRESEATGLLKEE